MLILSRKKGEQIVVGHDIVVKVLDCRGDRIRLGISAPAEVPVHRQEIHRRVQRDEEQSSLLATPTEVSAFDVLA